MKVEDLGLLLVLVKNRIFEQTFEGHGTGIPGPGYGDSTGLASRETPVVLHMMVYNCLKSKHNSGRTKLLL